MTNRSCTPIDRRIAHTIRACRKRLGMSQEQLARQLGVSFQQVQKYEAGTNRIGAGRLFQLAAIFNVPIQALFPTSPDRAFDAGSEQEPEILKFALSPEGWRLFQAFGAISKPQKRKALIDLATALVKSEV